MVARSTGVCFLARPLRLGEQTWEERDLVVKGGEERGERDIWSTAVPVITRAQDTECVQMTADALAQDLFSLSLPSLVPGL